MSNFFVVEFQTSEGWFASEVLKLAAARRRLSWLQAQAWVITARIMRGGQGGELTA